MVIFEAIADGSRNLRIGSQERSNETFTHEGQGRRALEEIFPGEYHGNANSIITRDVGSSQSKAAASECRTIRVQEYKLC